ncbi:ferric-dicitrate binding protein FerR, regulates iron transport through sigma-19 [Tenacibaculum sp. MAR_2009_124]|uniref:FecR family protein n=1 Tax=Tenacibaculum sp. MAR_2009_124 TaxID=1250059 RepID=UPI00089C0B68|nr:FecR family protein [Tenacibaculum sp. MAR_2009_124]SEB76644.1 ferric-dicitrate binding protein FerR, regulates iron transport through sigma-19 [Tenacibaculum sp. MAR_2009_124]
MEQEYLIKKWLNNDLDPQEQKAFDELEESAFYKEILVEGKRFKNQNSTKVIPFEELNKQLKLKSTQNKNWVYTLSKVAAVVAICFGVYFFMFQNNSVEYNTLLAQHQDIVLPDESEVVLNEESTLTFDKKTWKNEKKLHLKGEAFFKVTKGQRFDVLTEQGMVTVLGTEFDVVSRNNVFNVICYEGLVSVTYQNKEVKLPPGHAFKVIEGKADEYSIALSEPQWLHNMSVFKNAPLSEVLKTLEREYDVKIKTVGVNTNILFTGAFEHGNIENSLKAITETLHLTYEIEAKGLVVIKNAKD